MMNKNLVIKKSLWFVIALILILLFVNHYILRLLFNTAIIITIVYWITEDMNRSILIGSGISAVLFILYSPGGIIREGFEAEEEEKEKDKINIEGVADEILATETFGDEDVDQKPITMDDIKLANIPKLDNQYMEKMTPDKAQRETYRLINTLKQLDDTMKNLAPTLKMGNNIIEKFKKLNMAMEVKK